MSQRFTAYTHVTATGFALDPSLQWSACGWLYLIASSDGDLFSVQPSATPGSAYAIRLGYAHNGLNPTLRWRAGDGTSQLNHTEEIAIGEWHHLALTYDGTTARAYMDGALVDSQAMSMSGSYDSVDIGDFAFGSSTVELAQIKVWEGHALTVGELADEMAYWTPQSSPADLYAWWQLENAAPTLDSSGNARTLSGPGSSNGVNTPPGQLEPESLDVAAVGGTTSSGAAVVSIKLNVAASGGTLSAGYGWASTSDPTPRGSSELSGGRARLRRGRR